MIRLPCKVGDTVYYFLNVDDKIQITERKISTLANVITMMEDGEFNKTVFLTRTAAEEKLRELEEK